MKIVQFGKKDKKRTKEMCEFAHRLYKEHPVWLATPKSEVTGSIFTGNKGILRDGHPFHEHADAAYFLALDEKGSTLGSIAVVVNHAHNELYKDKVGFFGFFEVVKDYEVAKNLFDHAKNWLKEQGMEVMRGPLNFSTNDPAGLLIENFKDIPYMSTPYNFEYYQEFLENYGFSKVMDLIAESLPVDLGGEEEQKRRDRMMRVAEKIKKRYGISIEKFNKRKPKRHFQEIRDIYNEAWKDNWGYVPLSDKEFKLYFNSLGIIADKDLVRIAYIKGKPAAFIGALPDINEVFHKHRKSPELFNMIRILWWLFRKKYKRARLLLFGIKEEYRKMGLDAILFLDEFLAAQRNGYKSCEISWLLETNSLVIQAGKKLNAEVYKRWRVYDLAL